MKHRRITALFLAAALTACIVFPFGTAWAAAGVFSLKESYKVGEGMTYEQKEASFRDYIASNPEALKNVSWEVGNGIGRIKMDRIRPAMDGYMTHDANCTYNMPDSLKPGEKAKITYTLGGSISNAPSEWETPDVWIGGLSIGVYGGSDPGDMQFLTQLLPNAYNNMVDNSVSGQFDFDVPSGYKYLTVHVMHNTPIIGGIGMGYTYEISGEEAAPSEEPSASPSDESSALSVSASPELPTVIELGGVARSLENNPMAWMKLQAYVYFGASAYDTSLSPDFSVESVTDHMGRYQMQIPIGENNKEPVGILLVGTLTCSIPETGQRLFYFVDMTDAYAVDNEKTSLATWMTVNPAQYEHQPDFPIRLYRTLGFYNLTQGFWSDDGAGMTDPVYYFTAEPKEAEYMQDYSMLYTAAFEAWLFAAAELDESQALIGNPVRIETQRTPTNTFSGAYYAAGDNAIRLTFKESKRDDYSHYAILHEFGHAVDFLTSDSKNFRAAGGEGPNDVNHGGYLNSSTSDSYIEGFATFYAAWVQLNTGYDNPAVLSTVDLGASAIYTAWGMDGGYEEYAIASLLYYAQELIGDPEAFWRVIDPVKNNFAEYYDAIYKALPAESVKKLEEFAFMRDLFKMPFGNKKYDPGEPYLDQDDPWGPKNSQYDLGEPFGDLMYAVGDGGVIDSTAPIKEFDKSKLDIGTVSDALRERQSLYLPDSCFLYLAGEQPEYVLVTVAAAGGTTRMLSGVSEGRVFIGLPNGTLNGTMTVSVPGGGVIFESSLESLQQYQQGVATQDTGVLEAEVTADDLAAPGTQCVAVYCSADAAGVLEIPQITAGELEVLADGYFPNASVGEASYELSGGSFSQPEDGPYTGNDSSALLLILLVSAAVVIAGVIIAVVLIIRRQKRTAMQPAPVLPPPIYSPVNRFCTACGTPLKPDARFCALCGKPRD